VLPTQQSKDKSDASKTMDNKILNRYFLRTLSDKGVEIVFVDTRAVQCTWGRDPHGSDSLALNMRCPVSESALVTVSFVCDSASQLVQIKLLHHLRSFSIHVIS
jgi:hypothetical protein